VPLIRPFRALRYGADLVPSLPLLVSPSTNGEPTDRSVVGDVHEHNVRRLVRGDRGPLASAEEPAFTHAARLLGRWREDGIVVRDPRPSVYLYEQDDGVSSRRGLVCLVRLEESGSGPVRPHERTRGGSTTQLHAQLDAMRVQLSMTMTLVPDGRGALSDYLTRDHGPAGVEVVDGAGRRNAMWRDEDPATHLALMEALLPEVAVIADGHHRHDAAVRHRDGRAGGLPGRREHPWDYTMMMLVPVSEPGLRCEPTHRVCPALPADADALLPALLDRFEVVDLADDGATDAFLATRGGVRFAMVRPDRRQGLILKEDVAAAALADLPHRLRQVDAAVADHLLVAPLGGADTGRSGSAFAHNRASGRDVAEQALRGDVDLAVLLRSVPPRTVLEVAEQGHLMPPKSTNFVPKPAKGLLMSSLATF